MTILDLHPSHGEIIKAVSITFGVPVEDIEGTERTRTSVAARYAYVLLAYYTTRLTFADMGDLLGVGGKGNPVCSQRYHRAMRRYRDNKVFADRVEAARAHVQLLRSRAAWKVGAE